MSCSKVSRKNKSWTDAELKRALHMVRVLKRSQGKASKETGIPRSTLQKYLQSNTEEKLRKGAPKILSDEEENDLVDWIVQSSRKGYCPRPRQVCIQARKILRFFRTPQEVIELKTPGKKWFRLFLHRHAKLCIKQARAVTGASARVTEDNLRGWNTQLLNYLKSHSLEHLLLEPDRIWNCDESAFFFSSNKGFVVCESGGSARLQSVSNSDKDNLTVLYCVSASGDMVKPFVLLPYEKRIPTEVAESFNMEYFEFSHSTGWMTQSLFLFWIQNIFFDHLDKKKLPVILIADNHPSHFSVEISEKCDELGIILVSLFPNSTFISQPLDTACFAVVKKRWEKEIDDRRIDEPNFRVTLSTFGEILETVTRNALKKDIIARGFRITGLYPYDVEAIPFHRLYSPKNRRSTMPIVVEDNSENMGFLAYPDVASENDVDDDVEMDGAADKDFEMDSSNNLSGSQHFNEYEESSQHESFQEEQIDLDHSESENWGDSHEGFQDKQIDLDHSESENWGDSHFAYCAEESCGNFQDQNADLTSRVATDDSHTDPVSSNNSSFESEQLSSGTKDCELYKAILSKFSNDSLELDFNSDLEDNDHSIKDEESRVVQNFKKALFVKTKKRVYKNIQKDMKNSAPKKKILKELENGSFIPTDGISDTVKIMYHRLAPPKRASDILPNLPENFKAGNRKRAGDNLIVKSSVQWRIEKRQHLEEIQKKRDDIEKRKEERAKATALKKTQQEEKKKALEIKRAIAAEKKKNPLKKRGRKPKSKNTEPAPEIEEKLEDLGSYFEKENVGVNGLIVDLGYSSTSNNATIAAA